MLPFFESPKYVQSKTQVARMGLLHQFHGAVGRPFKHLRVQLCSAAVIQGTWLWLLSLPDHSLPNHGVEFSTNQYGSARDVEPYQQNNNRP